MSKAKSLGLKEVRTDMGLFEFTIICVAGSYDSYQKYIAWKFEDKDFVGNATLTGYEGRGECAYKTGYVPVIWIPRKPKTPRELATLAHESLHAVFHLLDWAAIPATRDTEEVIAHSVAHLVNNILEKL